MGSKKLDGHRPETIHRCGGTFNDLPPIFYGADWISTANSAQTQTGSFILNADADVYVAMDVQASQRTDWVADYENTGLFVKNDANGGGDWLFTGSVLKGLT